MVHNKDSSRRPVDARMMAAADRLFNEFDQLPVMTVIRTIGAARATLREQGTPVTPEAVEALARARLTDVMVAVA